MIALLLAQAETENRARTDRVLLGVIVALVAAAAVGSAFLMTRQAMNDSPETTRLKWGAAITAVAFVAIVAVFCTAAWMFDDANDVVATVGVITGVMGTVIGTCFGVQVGSTGTQAATAAAMEAARAAERAADSVGQAVQEAALARSLNPTP
jgi:hypothetical protein